MKNIIAQTCKIIQALAPIGTGSARTSDYVSLRGCGLCYVIANITQADATVMALTLEKATDVSGSGSTAITTAVPIWSNLDTAASDVLVRRTDAVSYSTDAGIKSKVVVFQIDAASLGGSYTAITLKCGLSHSTNILSAMYVLTDVTNQSEADDLVAQITD